MKDGGIWKLAGVIDEADCGYSLEPKGKQNLEVSWFDTQGLYRIAARKSSGSESWGSSRDASACLASRLSVRHQELQTILSQPFLVNAKDGEGALFLLLLPLLFAFCRSAMKPMRRLIARRLAQRRR